MGRSVGILLGIFWLVLVRTEGRFVVEKNSLTVTSPDSINGSHDSAIGNFGVPQYGGSMAGTVVYPKSNQKGCKGFDELGISFKPTPGALPKFVLVDRGDCFFTLKVWNAQNAGASAVLVSDDVDEPLITMDMPQDNEQSAKYIENITIPSDMPQDNEQSAKYIENITIPSALIKKGFGEKLKNAINEGEMVNVNLDWREAVPHPDARVEYEL